MTPAELRSRVLAVLRECGAGDASGNWRDSDPGYWIGVAEGAASAEPLLDLCERLAQSLQALVVAHGDCEEGRACAACARAWALLSLLEARGRR